MSDATPPSHGEPSGDEPTGDEERSLLPAALAGAGILAVAALLIFWPSGDSAQSGEGTGAGSGAAQAAGAGPGGAGAGVPARAYDEPAARENREVRMNPAVRLSPRGMAPEGAQPDPEPPEFESEEQEIAWYEDQLQSAEQMLTVRKNAVERLPVVEERLEEAPDAEQRLEDFERRKRIVEDNLVRAQARVNELEEKLAELRGG